MATKYYKTTITITVLSEGQYMPMSLSGIEYDIQEGDCSGTWDISKVEELSPETMANALLAQGSDPLFFGLGDDIPESFGTHQVHDIG